MRQDTQRATCTLSLVPRIALSFICTGVIPTPSALELYAHQPRHSCIWLRNRQQHQPACLMHSLLIRSALQSHMRQRAQTLKRARAVLKRILGPSRNSTSQMRTAVSAGSAVQKRLLNQLLVTSCRDEDARPQPRSYSRPPSVVNAHPLGDPEYVAHHHKCRRGWHVPSKHTLAAKCSGMHK